MTTEAKVESTLTPDEYDSIVDDDFEVIDSNVKCSQNDSLSPGPEASTEQTSQLSIEQSITLNSLPNCMVGKLSPKQTTLSKPTPVLDRSMGRKVSGINENTLKSWESNETLHNMIESQTETKELLISSIDRIEDLTKQIDELKLEVASQAEKKEVLTDKIAKMIIELKQIDELKQEVAGQAEKNEVLTDKIAKLTNELKQTDELKQKITSLEKMISEMESLSSDTIKSLNGQIDEMVAKYLTEKETRTLIEEQLNSIQQGHVLGACQYTLQRRRSGISSRENRPMLYNEKALSEQLKQNEEKIEQLERKVETMDEEIRNRDEIIKILREEDLEGRRLIAEKEHKISDLERILTSYDERLQLGS